MKPVVQFAIEYRAGNSHLAQNNPLNVLPQVSSMVPIILLTFSSSCLLSRLHAVGEPQCLGPCLPTVINKDVQLHIHKVYNAGSFEEQEREKKNGIMAIH